MNTSKTSTADFDKKVIAICSLLPADNEKEWALDFSHLWDMSVPLALMIQRGWVTDISDEGVKAIEDCFTALSAVVGASEEDLLKAAEG
jgi:hypothetical protein